jgi:putative phosphoesterase
VRIGILSDTHDQVDRTRDAVNLLRARGADVIVHCGDLTGPDIVAECAVLPLYFAFGNRDCDLVHLLQNAATEHGATCLGWGGEFTVAKKRIAVVHGHLTMDLRPLLDANPDYLLSGHSPIAGDWYDGVTRRINPGALAEADEYSVAILDLETDVVQFFPVP